MPNHTAREVFLRNLRDPIISDAIVCDRKLVILKGGLELVPATQVWSHARRNS